MRRIRVSLLPVLFAVLFGPRIFAAAPATTKAVDDQKEMEALWDDLAKGEPWDTRAILQFSDRPQQTVAFFATHLKPLKIAQRRLDELKTALSSEDEKIWKPAFTELEYFDPRLNEDPSTMLDAINDPLEKTRLAEVMNGSQADQWKGYDVSCTASGQNTRLKMYKNRSWGYIQIYNKISQLGTWNSQWQRTDRALVILQHIGTKQAIAVLKDMATGHHGAQPTQIAKLALASLGCDEK